MQRRTRWPVLFVLLSSAGAGMCFAAATEEIAALDRQALQRLQIQEETARLRLQLAEAQRALATCEAAAVAHERADMAARYRLQGTDRVEVDGTIKRGSSGRRHER